MSIEAMKQALEALECALSDDKPYIDKSEQAITSLHHAIAEAEKQDGDCKQCGGKGCVACDAREQEPVAWMFQHDETGRMTYLSNDGFHNPTMFIEMNPRYALVCSLYTHPQPKREWVWLEDKEIWSLITWIGTENSDVNPLTILADVRAVEFRIHMKNNDAKQEPKREWVGLTLEEILETYRGPDGSDYVDYARAIEAKLKEKNT